MKRKAEEELSESIVVGLRVVPRGVVNREAMAGAAGAIGAGVHKLVASDKRASAVTTPRGYQKAMFLAVTPTRVAFFQIVIGAGTLGPLIAEYPRSAVTRCETQRGTMQVPFFMTRPIDLELESGEVFALESITLVFMTGAIKKLEDELQH